MNLHDTFTIDGARRTGDGYLTAFARVARTGIQEYKGSELGRPDLGTVKVYRPESEVFAPDAMKSFAHRPITLTHPKVPVNSKNWKTHAKGQTGDEVVRDGQFVRVPMVMMDQSLIDAYERGGVRELSMGYSTDLKWEAGTTPDGMTYDAVQTNIRGNHLAVVPVARGGDQLRIGDDKDNLGHGSNKRGGGDDSDQDHATTIRNFRNALREAKFKHLYSKEGTEVSVKYDKSTEKAVSAIAKKHGMTEPYSVEGRTYFYPKKSSTQDSVTLTLDAAGDPNHGKVGVVLGLHPTDSSRTLVRFGDTTTPYPTKYLKAVDADQDVDPDLEECPECGAEIPADSDVCPECGYDLTTDSATKGDHTMKQIIIDGVPVDVVNDQGGAIIERHISKLDKDLKDAAAKITDAEAATTKAATELADAKKTIETKDGEIAALKKQVEDAKVTPAKLDIMVKDRLAVVDKASKVLDKNFAFDGKSIEEIRRAAVAAKLGDAAAKDMSDASVEGAFTVLTAGVATGGTRQLRDGLSQPRPIHSAMDARDAAYEEGVKTLSNNWRGNKAAS